jgi:hydroxymethylglutaryl-CoA lyase
LPRARGYLAGLMKGIGVQHVGVADTIGVGTPRKVQRAIEATLQHYGMDARSGHFHDTYGQALANTLAALELGVWHFDTVVAGLGGCPYAKGATGNVATEDVVFMLHGMGIETGIDLDKLVDAGALHQRFPGAQAQLARGHGAAEQARGGRMMCGARN